MLMSVDSVYGQQIQSTDNVFNLSTTNKGMVPAFSGHQYFIPMHLLKTTIIAASVLLLASCSKKETTVQNEIPETENCAGKSALVSGDIIPGQYIVGYKSSAGTGKVTAQRMEEITRDVLQE